MSRRFIISSLLLSSLLSWQGASGQNWRELLNKADSLAQSERQDSAIAIGRLALEKAEEEFGEQDTSVAVVLHQLGVYTVSMYFVFDFYEVESGLKRAIAIRERAYGKDHPSVAATSHVLAILYSKHHMWDEADPLYRRALAIREKAFGPCHLETARSLTSLGIFCLRQYKCAAAEDFFKRSLEIRQEVLGPDDPDVAQSLIYLGAIYQLQGRYEQAESAFRQSLQIRERALAPDHPDVAASLSELGAVYEKQARYAEAESCFKRSLEIREKALGPDHPDVSESLVKLGAIYQHQGRHDEAEKFHMRSLEISEKTLGRNHPRVAAGLANLGGIYLEQHRYELCDSMFSRSLTICEYVFDKDDPDILPSLINLAHLRVLQGRWDEAESLWLRSLTITEAALDPSHPAVATSLHNLGAFDLERGKYAEAELLLDRALEIRERALGIAHPDVAETARNLAILHASLGEIDKSLQYYEKRQRSGRQFVEYVFSYASEGQKMRYIETYPLLDHSVISFALLTDSDSSAKLALEMVLRGKGTVLDAVSSEREIAYCSYSPGLREKAERHARICGEISNLTLAEGESLSRDIHYDRLRTLRLMKDSLETELSKDCAAFRDQVKAKSFTVADVAGALTPGSLLWEFIRYTPFDFKKVGSDSERLGAPRYLAFALDHAGDIRLVDLGAAGLIDSLVTLARKQIYSASKEVYSPLAAGAEERLKEVTGRLYDMILAPLEPSLGGRTDIFISPDGQLSLLPFEILSCPDGKYLVEKYRVSYLSSGRDLLKFRRAGTVGDRALVLADPDFDLADEALAERRAETLKEPSAFAVASGLSRGVSSCLSSPFTPLRYSQVENKSVVNALSGEAHLQVDSYLGGDALEEILKAVSVAPRILHLATHGYFCEDVDPGAAKMLENPLLRCGLAFAGANRLLDEDRESDLQMEDGVLTAFEASGLNLIGTELVTLSACETGMGEVKVGEGVYGLRRAFQCAGAETIVMSLWKVPDKETAELMGRFYKSWLSGQTKKQALRQAVLEVLNHCRERYGVAHPLFWGGFVMLGNPN